MEAAKEDALVYPDNHRALWWIADDPAELEKWNLKEKGCTILKTEPHPAPSKQIDVVFSLDPKRARAAIGYEPEDSEWLER